MSTAVMKAPSVSDDHAGSSAAAWRTDPVAQAFWLLRIGFTVAPILFGTSSPIGSSTGTGIWLLSSPTCCPGRRTS